MVEQKLGIDFDGILHDSFAIALDTLNRTLELSEMQPVTANWLKENFTTQWKVFFNRLQIPEDKHKEFHEKFRSFEIKNPLGELVLDAKEFLAVVLEKFGQKNVVLISNNQELLIKRFFKDNNLPDITIIATPHGKVQTLKEQQITLYVGDIIDDGKAAIAAGCKFLGIAHYASFGSNTRMSLFADFNRNLGVVKANSLKEAATHIMRYY